MQKTKIQSVLTRALLGLVALLLLVGLNYILTTRTDQHNDDFSAFWIAGHLLGQGTSPYDHAATVALQDAIGNTRHDPLLYATPYPLWTILLFVPFGFFDIDIGAALWLTLNEFLAGLTFYLLASTLVLGQPPRAGRRLFSHLFNWGFVPFLLSVHFVRCLLNGQLSIILLAVVSLFIWATARQHWRVAGVALLAVLFKPTSLILFAAVALLWLLLNKERRAGIYTFAIGAMLLLAVGFGLDHSMLAHMYDASTAYGRSITFRNATLWGVCATVARNIGGPDAEIWGWLVAAFLGAIAAWVGWLSFQTLPATLGPIKAVTGWSLLLVLSICLTWYAFSYESVLLLLPLLAILTLIRREANWQRKTVGVALVLVLGVIPYLMNLTPLDEHRAGLFPTLLLAVLLVVVARWPLGLSLKATSAVEAEPQLQTR